MKYDLVEIRTFGIGDEKKWDVRWSKDDTDRVDRKPYKPHPLGFFHYPRFMGVEESVPSSQGRDNQTTQRRD